MKQNDLLQARSDDAELSVYELTEFVFCPRAGLCTHEQKEVLPEPETPPNASFLPIHDENELRFTLKATIGQLCNIVLGGGAATIVFAVMAWLSGWISLWCLTLCCFLLTTYAVCDRLYWIALILQNLKIWKMAASQTIDIHSPKIQYVHWCELIRSEFELTEPQGAFHHIPWRLGGKPYRLLEKGALRIPVFRPTQPWKDLYPQHFVRIAAYCRLIEAKEGFQSPCGVIVMPDSFQAIIVPCSAKSREDFKQAVLRSRMAIRDSEERNVFPPEPENKSLCRDCPHGRPQVFRNGKPFIRGDITLAPRVFAGRDGKRYHCLCGDRFHWDPPHDLAESLRPLESEMPRRR
ncbi:MAG: hypothetical protein IT426_21065 [Pirellulales bacterium]|nr:hypothetical protein [Pirellulales bacterium]